MEPALRNDELKLVNQWAYLWREPQLGEVVVFQNPQNPAEILCKRIQTANPVAPEYQLLGDNPADSLDSRRFGPIKKSQILGRVIG